MLLRSKYSPVGELSEFAGQYADVIARISMLPTLICDTDHVIAAAGIPKREYLERRVSSVLESYMDSRKTYTATQQNVGGVQPIEGVVHEAAVISPIIASGDVMGAVGGGFSRQADGKLKNADSFGTSGCPRYHYLLITFFCHDLR